MPSDDFSELFALPIVIHTDRLLLTTPSLIHAPVLADFYRRNADFLQPFAAASKEKFKIEGQAKDYLLINGKWEDHVLTALTNPHWNSEKKS